MKCARFKDLIIEEAAGTIAEADKLVLDEHLQSCSECVAEKEKFALLLDGIGRSDEQDPGEAYWTSFNERIFSKISQRQTADRRAWPLPIRIRYVLAAAVVALFVIGLPLVHNLVTKKTMNDVRFEEQLQSALNGAGNADIDALIDRMIPFYQNQSLLSSALDSVLLDQRQSFNVNYSSSEGLIPYMMIDDLDDNEQDALQSQIESEMI